ncbi:ribonuclease H-like domain-containing protein [Paenibacillus elgii]|uniref:ribonuclease H-like domain-containing protein n=1 Tax=Paenibacillus elgii TaxID=189691 RepID=UPI002041F6D0|nr:ribonuclease H-like domain-containing protein [Paenibacillus elgii]MCM3271591.1 ribonuclease H-like domain-containing protein [Paenibacillus elgii]
MSSLKERLLRHKKSIAGTQEREEEAKISVGEEPLGSGEEGQAAHGQSKPESAAEVDEWSVVGAAMEHTEWGDFVIRRRTYETGFRHGQYELSRLSSCAEELFALLEPTVGSATSNRSAAPFHERLLFLDTETTGLGHGAGNVPFMIGVGFYQGNQYHIEQMLIRHPGEESAMLAYLEQKLAAHPVLISYNGKSFDWPIVKNRYIMNRMELAVEPEGHIDFLHPSRSLWRHTLPSCRLGKVEEERLGVRREEDVPGSLAPTLYFQYLAQRDPSVLEGVFVHNELDVLSLAGLAVHFACLLNGSHDWSCARLFGLEECFRLGLWLDKIGRSGMADTVMNALTEELLAADELASEEPCLLPLAQFYKRRGGYTQACSLWSRYIALKGDRATASLEPYIELSMYYEHKEKQWERALDYAQEALDHLWRRDALKRSRERKPIAHGGKRTREKEEREEDADAISLRKRIERLRRKVSSPTRAIRVTEAIEPEPFDSLLPPKSSAKLSVRSSGEASASAPVQGASSAVSRVPQSTRKRKFGLSAAEQLSMPL